MKHGTDLLTGGHTWSHEVEQVVVDLFPQLVELRRHLHAHPEPSGEEYQTSRYLYDWLLEHRITSRLVLGGRGVLLDLATTSTKNRFALRADTDAIRIQDSKHVAYRSQADNVMHACGHDAHAAILAGAILTIHELAEGDRLPWPVPVRGIFQPSEETCSGAKEMIDEQALEDVGSVLALHVDPTRDMGRIGLRPGVMTASCDELIITIRGQGGHAARPHHTRDPITAAAQFINAVHVQVPRGTDSLDTVVIGFGRIAGGEQCNVIPSSVELRGTLRTLINATRISALTRLREIAQGVGQFTQTDIELQLGASAPAVENNPALTAHLAHIAADVLGADAGDMMTQPSVGSEDFAFYLDVVPGVMFRLGTRSPGQETTGLHTPTFDIDESAIAVGVRLLAQAAIAWFDPERT